MSLDKPHRVLLINYDAGTEMTTLRHFVLTTNNHEVSRAVKRLRTQQAVSRTLPNLEQYGDIASYVLEGGNASESEAEDYWREPSSSAATPSRDEKTVGISRRAEEKSEENEDEEDATEEVLDRSTAANTEHDDARSMTSHRSSWTSSTSGLTSGGLRAIKLKETGPRLDLKLLKIVEGVNEGEVLFENKAPSS